MTDIRANNIDIHETVEIGNNVRINCDTIKLGKFCKIGNNVTIDCKTFESDEWLFMLDGVEIGRGGCYGPNSNVKIGKGVGIFENTIINPSESVEIGDNCGIGGDVMIWTHGAWLDVLQGFPSDFGPVRIGNVSIGDNVVIGINSIINRDLPSGCLAAGAPCKVIKEKLYPKKVTLSEQSIIIKNIVGKWYDLHENKGIDNVKTKYENGKIKLIQGKNVTIYDISNKTIKGYINNVSEDLRDFLRRNGIKIYTDRFFTSMTPTWMNK
jgi:acetyltransferase-like isoleucine patch superfamily enzyme